ncbi:MAG: hypothetical protein EOM54_10035 [Clostridia bacterium]|nr:hypothetical protein [Clostridia bacterium]
MEPEDSGIAAFYVWNGERIVCRQAEKRRKYTDKQFRRHLILFVLFGIGIYAAMVIALGAFGVA